MVRGMQLRPGGIRSRATNQWTPALFAHDADTASLAIEGMFVAEQLSAADAPGANWATPASLVEALGS